MKIHLMLLAFLLGAGLKAQNSVTVVAADGSGDYKTLQEAVNACSADSVRHLVFIKNGIYEERVNLSKGKTISLIGESRDGVVITNNRNRGKESRYRNFRDITTMLCNGDDFYMENLTVANTAGDVGQAEAHYIAGDRQVYRNCKFTGFQDTQRTNGGARAYLRDCFIEGAVDFIYGDGLIYYDRCTINSVNGGGYVTAPAECSATEPGTDGKMLHYGYVFNRCNLTAKRDVKDGSYYLGRPWKKEAASYFINCTLGTHINARGWKEWNGTEATADMAEWGSLTPQGKPADVSGRAEWSRQLSEEDALRLTPEYVFTKLHPEKNFDYQKFCAKLDAPAYVKIQGETLTWGAVKDAVAYLVYYNGRFMTVAYHNSCKIVKKQKALYSVKAVSRLGVTGLEAESGK